MSLISKFYMLPGAVRPAPDWTPGQVLRFKSHPLAAEAGLNLLAAVAPDEEYFDYLRLVCGWRQQVANRLREWWERVPPEFRFVYFDGWAAPPPEELYSNGWNHDGFPIFGDGQLRNVYINLRLPWAVRQLYPNPDATVLPEFACQMNWRSQWRTFEAVPTGVSLEPRCRAESTKVTPRGRQRTRRMQVSVTRHPAPPEEAPEDQAERTRFANAIQDWEIDLSRYRRAHPERRNGHREEQRGDVDAPPLVNFATAARRVYMDNTATEPAPVPTPVPVYANLFQDEAPDDPNPNEQWANPNEQWARDVLFDNPQPPVQEA